MQGIPPYLLNDLHIKHFIISIKCFSLRAHNMGLIYSKIALIPKYWGWESAKYKHILECMTVFSLKIQEYNNLI